MYNKCKICGQKIEAKSARGLAYHLNHYHSKVDHKDYYIKYIDSRTRCVDCGCEMKFHGLTYGFYERCKPCSIKSSWVDDISRKEKLRERFKENNPSVGRPKGSKNKNPYPESARQLLSEQNRGRKAVWNLEPNKIDSQKKTWESKSTEEITEIYQKQLKTKEENGTVGQFYQGRFKPKNPSKYRGDAKNIIYRSSWELAALKWADSNDNIKSYSSEEIVIPYYYEVDKRTHRYFVDMFLEYVDGRKILVEIKPKKETSIPKKQGKSKNRYMTESLTYIKNQNKWAAAHEYCKDRGWTFEIWTEDTLKGMNILKSLKSPKKLKPLKPYRKKIVK